MLLVAHPRRDNCYGWSLIIRSLHGQFIRGHRWRGADHCIRVLVLWLHCSRHCGETCGKDGGVLYDGYSNSMPCIMIGSNTAYLALWACSWAHLPCNSHSPNWPCVRICIRTHNFMIQGMEATYNHSWDCSEYYMKLEYWKFPLKLSRDLRMSEKA